MTTQENDAGAKLDRLTANLARVEELTERLVNGLAKKKAHDAALNGPSNDVYVKAAAAYLAGRQAGRARRALGFALAFLCAKRTLLLRKTVSRSYAR